MTPDHGSARYWGIAALLAALAMLGPFSIDAFFPSFHALAAHFALSKWALQQTLTAYMLPLSIMSLVQGPLSDAFGRRRVILGGLALYTVASVGCALAASFTTLLVFRAIQGMSAGAGVIVGRAIIRDLYEGPQAQKLLSLVTMIFGFAPAVAPVIGGWIHVTLGWRAVFGFMALFSALLALAAYLTLPETHPAELRARLHAPELTRSAMRVAAHRTFLLLALAMGANFAAVMVFIGAAPSVVIDHWQLRETQFAWLFAPIIGGFILGAWISGRMAGRVAAATQCKAGFAFALAGSGLMVALQVMLGALPILAQQLLLAAIALGVQLVSPILVLRMLDLFPRARGAAASVQSCVSIVISAAVFGALAPLLSNSLATLAEGSLGAALVSFGLWRSAQHRVSLAHRPSGNDTKTL
ncbi:MAG: multidrug effflux MFS transporter [Gammaproteobacteria bacterium]|nr:MAG: multidrug effflux MFS transporter [Gammaproteobacteria bacterium]